MASVAGSGIRSGCVRPVVGLTGTIACQKAKRGPPRMPNMQKRPRHPNFARMMGEIASPSRFPACHQRLPHPVFLAGQDSSDQHCVPEGNWRQTLTAVEPREGYPEACGPQGLGQCSHKIVHRGQGHPFSQPNHNPRNHNQLESQGQPQTLQAFVR